MVTLSRRKLLKCAGLSALAISALPERASTTPLPSVAREWTVTGHAIPELANFDQTMQTFMQARTISGAALAVTRDSKLVFARGYTYTDDSQDSVVQPTTLFRIASISKPITAVAILRLVQEGRLDLAAKVTDLLTLTPPAGQTPDARLPQITVRRLLQHLGGWNRDSTFDPMFRDRTIASALGATLPIQKSHIITYMTGQPLQHTPGTTYAYSNYGYCLLGQIIEKVTGQSYSAFVNQQIFAPLGVLGMTLGQSLSPNRRANEVKYHSRFTGSTVFEPTPTPVPFPYGGFNLENMDAHGGWVTSAVALARFAATFDDPNSSPVLNAAHINLMFGLPEHIEPANYQPGSWYYGNGWAVRDWGVDGRNTWHDGSLAGTYTLLVRRRDGLNWCVLFNQRDDSSGLAYDAIDGALHSAADSVATWPTHDFFAEYLRTYQAYLPTINR